LEPAVITLDTSGVVSMLNRRDPYHDQVGDILQDDPGPHIVPSPILAEIAYLSETRLGPGAMEAFLADIERGAYVLDCCLDDLARVRQLIERYADLPLGFADASVIACAERNGGRVLTLDRRDFGVVAREGRISLLP
jgi:predicted nucleic acid-binding protein